MEKNTTNRMDFFHVRMALRTLLTLMIVFTTGCDTFNKPKPPRIGEEQRFLVHLTRTNHETFWQIAKWYTGDYKRSKELLALNAKTAVNGLQTGETVLVPFANLRTLAPMPEVTKPKKKKSGKRQTKRSGSPTVSESVDYEEEVYPSEIPEKTTLEQMPEPISPPDLTENEPSPPPQQYEILQLPSGPDSSTTPSSPLGDGGKSLEDLVKEEQAELEQLKKELNTH